MEKGHLLEIHLLEKTARHQNLDCSTLFKQMTKIYQSARDSLKKCRAVEIRAVAFRAVDPDSRQSQEFFKNIVDNRCKKLLDLLRKRRFLCL
jgi:hypothetical protein